MKDLGVGSTPVREAVLELLARGILVQESHRSVRVAELDLDRLRNIYRTRALLETEAARIGTAKISDEAVETMRRLLRAHDRVEARGRHGSRSACRLRFPSLLYAAAENPVLLDLIHQAWNLFPGSILWNIPGRIAQSIKEHHAIFDAVQRRDPTAAAYAIENHLLTALAALEAHIVVLCEAIVGERATKILTEAAMSQMSRIARRAPRRSEAEPLAKAAQYSFRARMDKKTNEGPVFERAAGSVVWDVNDKEYLDFNSGQMCSALGHNHPTITAAIKDGVRHDAARHSSHYNVKEISSPRGSASSCRRRCRRAFSASPARTPTRWR